MLVASTDSLRRVSVRFRHQPSTYLVAVLVTLLLVFVFSSPAYAQVRRTGVVYTFLLVASLSTLSPRHHASQRVDLDVSSCSLRRGRRDERRARLVDKIESIRSMMANEAALGSIFSPKSTLSRSRRSRISLWVPYVMSQA